MSDTYYPFLHGIGLQLDFQNSGDIASDLYDLVQNSALLSQEVTTLGNEGYGADLVPSGQAGTNPIRDAEPRYPRHYGCRVWRQPLGRRRCCGGERSVRRPNRGAVCQGQRPQI